MTGPWLRRITRPWLEGLSLRELRDLASRYGIPADGRNRQDLITDVDRVARDHPR